jgi:hypothetical protein
MSPDDLSIPLDAQPFDLLPEDWDEIADGEIDIAGIRLEALADSMERM